MPGITFNDFRSNVREVARPNRFLLTIPTPPTGITGFNFDDQMVYHVRSASLPPRALGDITNLLWFGLNTKLAGDPTYDDYAISFLNNVDWKVKNLFEKWVDGIASPVTNERLSHGDYKAVLKLEQIGRTNEVIATYYIHGAYPKSLDAVELAQETVDAIEDFTVNFSIDYWTSDITPGAGAGVGEVGSPVI